MPLSSVDPGKAPMAEPCTTLHQESTLLSRMVRTWWRSRLPVTGPEDRRGGWIQTFSGNRFWPMDPRAADVHLEDVAHHLAMRVRYMGAGRLFYSVGQHSVLLSEAVEGGPEVAYAALHADDPEYVLPDIPSPVKPFIPGWKYIEGAAEQAIVIEAFGVQPDALPLVKPYDRRIVADEVASNLAPSLHPWKVRPEPLGILIEPWSPEVTEARYLQRHHELYAQVLAERARPQQWAA